MKADSNILKFSSMFNHAYSIKIDEQAIERIFGKRQLFKKNYPENTSLQKSAKAYPVDQIQISSRGRDFQIAKAAVQASPDIREEVTAPIKERVQNGTYAVETSSFADKLLQKYEEMR
jgi:negative regulator of flagellin synthesis FlgM